MLIEPLAFWAAAASAAASAAAITPVTYAMSAGLGVRPESIKAWIAEGAGMGMIWGVEVSRVVLVKCGIHCTVQRWT